MEGTQKKRAVMVGLFVSIGLLVLVGGILMVGNLHETFQRKMKVTSLFDDVNGLQMGNNVWFSGVKVGTVSGLHFYGKSKVQVSIKIELKVQEYIRKDCMVKISTDGLIGNKILVIYGGSARSPEVQEGDTLGVEKTFSQEDMVNTLQENNRNLLAITGDLKGISSKVAAGEGTIGKLLAGNEVYDHINAATLHLENAAAGAEQLAGSLKAFGAKFGQKGTLANDLVTDTMVFRSIRSSVVKLQHTVDTAGVIVNSIDLGVNSPHSAVGVLLHDKEAAARIRQILLQLESSTKKLDEDLEAAQHSFLLKGFFKNKKPSGAK